MNCIVCDDTQVAFDKVISNTFIGAANKQEKRFLWSVRSILKCIYTVNPLELPERDGLWTVEEKTPLKAADEANGFLSEEYAKWKENL